MENITIPQLPIRLGQFLKLASLVQDGFEAKIRIQEGQVSVNGIIEIRRGRKLLDGDIVTCDKTSYQVCAMASK
jgi:ribosome-associated protein